jgi:hypothetical protein
MKNGSLITFSKKLKFWKLYVTNKIALVKDEDFPFWNRIPSGWSPTKIFRLKSNSTSRHLHYFYGGLWLLVLPNWDCFTQMSISSQEWDGYCAYCWGVDVTSLPLLRRSWCKMPPFLGANLTDKRWPPKTLRNFS